MAAAIWPYWMPDAVTKASKPAAAMPGLASGTEILRKVFHQLLPAIR